MAYKIKVCLIFCFTNWAQWHMPMIPVIWKVETGGLQVLGQPELSMTLSQNKKAGECTSVVKYPLIQTLVPKKKKKFLNV